MALGTNYRRNAGKEDYIIAVRIAKAKELAKVLGGDLGLASAVVLGRLTEEQAKAKAKAKA